ncbi:transposase [Amycolatopsis mediterranei S699]|uniref:Transposase remnant n=1 Tax=Amycolatopsis mediterranei (strain U-32) TaxID=749927 RepID=A0A0H3DCM4_AMYMU|nr:transposase remnant [Amycolatopsis mediterranei U32]AFO79095.1 transposase [Amycolatopsis mediterranei S699]AGT86223.1 transposase [Amycolatopsis mediterranei RB]
MVKTLPEALAPWRKPLATHNPGQIVLDLAIGSRPGDFAVDVSVLRVQLVGQAMAGGLQRGPPPVSGVLVAIVCVHTRGERYDAP